MILEFLDLLPQVGDDLSILANVVFDIKDVSLLLSSDVLGSVGVSQS